MTKKDYELIADILQQTKANIDNKLSRYQYAQVCEYFADGLEDTNPLFDRERFLLACQP